jgi:hypothetical protein
VTIAVSLVALFISSAATSSLALAAAVRPSHVTAFMKTTSEFFTRGSNQAMQRTAFPVCVFTLWND